MTQIAWVGVFHFGETLRSEVEAGKPPSRPSAKAVTLDFQAMRLTLEGNPRDAELRAHYDAHRWFQLRDAAAVRPDRQASSSSQ